MTRHRAREEMFDFESCGCARCNSNAAGWMAVMAFGLLYGTVLKPCYGDFLDMEIEQRESRESK